MAEYPILFGNTEKYSFIIASVYSLHVTKIKLWCFVYYSGKILKFFFFFFNIWDNLTNKQNNCYKLQCCVYFLGSFFHSYEFTYAEYDFSCTLVHSGLNYFNSVQMLGVGSLFQVFLPNKYGKFLCISPSACVYIFFFFFRYLAGDSTFIVSHVLKRRL